MPINYRYANITKFCRFGTYSCFRLNNLFQHANSTCQVERMNEPKPPFFIPIMGQPKSGCQAQISLVNFQTWLHLVNIFKQAHP